jgi:hypothetical protein
MAGGGRRCDYGDPGRLIGPYLGFPATGNGLSYCRGSVRGTGRPLARIREGTHQEHTHVQKISQNLVSIFPAMYVTLTMDQVVGSILPDLMA